MKHVMIAGMAISALLMTAAMADDHAPQSVTIGDLTLSFDAAIWRVEGGGDRYVASPVKADPGNAVAIGIGDGQSCTPAAMEETGRLAYPDAWTRGLTTIHRPGFDLHIATLDMGCRNWTGSPVFACAAYLGKGYFVTADPGGCATPPHYDSFVIGLLAGLAAP
jgi:hypothetical protein